MSILIVDLDHTLIKTDTFEEALIGAFKTQPLKSLKSLPKAFIDWTTFKEEIFGLATSAKALTPATLPYRQALVDRIKKHREQGGEALLASASPLTFCKEVAAHLGVFNHVMGSVPQHPNLKGKVKAQAISQFVKGRAFTYAGDSRSDLEVWKTAAHAIVVNPSSSLLGGIHAPRTVEILKDKKGLRPLFRALRLHQWVKNMLLFVPLLAAHRLRTDLGLGLQAFFAFSFAASSVYLLNDLMDLSSDRKHATKKLRPFAAGDLSPRIGLLGSVGLFCLSFGIASPLSASFLWVLGGYFVSNLLYSGALKKLLVLDVLMLAGLYSLRIFAGGAATGIVISSWLLAFSLFFFLGLALMKRMIELRALSLTEVNSKVAGRGYSTLDLPVVLALGVTSSFVSVLVFSLYVSSAEIMNLYSQSRLLWWILPILLYWISRIWILAWRGLVAQDPVVFALKDPPSYGAVLLLLAVFVGAI